MGVKSLFKNICVTSVGSESESIEGKDDIILDSEPSRRDSGVSAVSPIEDLSMSILTP